MCGLVALVVVVFVGIASMPLSAFPVLDARALSATGELRLWMELGRLELLRGEEPRVDVEAILPPGMVLRWRDHAGGTSLRVEDPHRTLPRQARLVIRVPAGVDLRLDVGDAAVVAEGVGGRDLVLRGGRGPVSVRDPTGALAVETTAGGIRLQTARPGRVRLRSLGGSIDVELGATRGADAVLETFTGPITLRLAPGMPATLLPRLARRDLSLPVGATGRPDGSVVLGEGGGRIVLESFGGGVRVMEDATIPVTGLAAPGAESEPDPLPGQNEAPTRS